MPNASSEIGTIATGSHGDYVGRFAPSPTGPLHFGSLLAALASRLEADAHRGRWLLRVEDIDPPRAQPGATDLILHALERYGFEWDGAVSYQSKSRDAHDAAVAELLDAGLAYRCGCSRRDLATAKRGELGIIYPGTCRNGCDASEFAVRVRTESRAIGFDDALQGRQSQDLEAESGDFVILRRDGLIAYQLAVVVDDALQGITDIVRGIDLMSSTPRQLWLQRLLGYAEPRYAHLPVAINKRGQKLSKSHGAGPISLQRPQETLAVALDMLGQHPPAGLADGSIDDVWAWARQHWQMRALRGVAAIPVEDIPLAHAENPLS